MKRRNFIKNISLASLSVPFAFKNLQLEAITKDLFIVPKIAEDRVLVLIRLNGGNDGLNTLIPLDQYDNLMVHRSNIIQPTSSIISLTSQNGLHGSMTGMANLFQNGKLAIIQNVGYPEQNRSHFRSMDIWSTGMMDINATQGWLGRSFDSAYPNFPSDYPNSDFPDPFAISMGYEVSSTCQGLMGNFSHTVVNPFDSVNLNSSVGVNDGTYYGAHMEYLTTIINQTNAYASQVNSAANAGNTLSTLYDDSNPLAVQMRYIAQMISGGLKTKVYILNVNGFDTHDLQVAATDSTQGSHANLLKMLSDAIHAFQDDLALLGVEHKVAGMTFSEFGRQIASNASIGTDHGDAAPLFIFGGCISSGILGTNPIIPTQLQDQDAIPMQIDFRDVYASVLKEWFLVDPTEIQALFEHTVTYYNVLSACNLGIEETSTEATSCIVFPNPAYSKTTVKFDSLHEKCKLYIIDLSGRIVQLEFETVLSPQTHLIPINIDNLSQGTYRIQIEKESGNLSVLFQKLN